MVYDRVFQVNCSALKASFISWSYFKINVYLRLEAGVFLGGYLHETYFHVVVIFTFQVTFWLYYLGILRVIVLTSEYQHPAQEYK